MIAALFPGEGSEYPGMSELISGYGSEQIDAGFDFSKLDSDVLDDRLNAQIAIYLASTFLWDKFSKHTDFAFLAGHSLGFYSALYAAGVIGRNDGIEIIRNAFSAIKEVSSEMRGGIDRKSTRLNSSHTDISRMPSSA